MKTVEELKRERELLEGEAHMAIKALVAEYGAAVLKRRSDAELRTFIAAVSKILEGSGV